MVILGLSWYNIAPLLMCRQTKFEYEVPQFFNIRMHGYNEKTLKLYGYQLLYTQKHVSPIKDDTS